MFVGYMQIGQHFSMKWKEASSNFHIHGKCKTHFPTDTEGNNTKQVQKL